MGSTIVLALMILASLPGTLAEAAPGGTGSTDPFAWSRTLRLYGDNNLKDGFAPESDTAEFAVYTSDGQTYILDGGCGMLSVSMIRNGNLLSLAPGAQGTTINCYILSDGVAGAFLLNGQEADDPADISINLALWAADTVVTGAQIAGDWEMTEIEDTNLSNLSSPFVVTHKTLSIADLGDGLVEVRFPVEGGEVVTWRMKLVGNRLLPLPGTLDPVVAHLKMMTDGYSLAMSAVGVEPWDYRDVSASIAFASRERPAPSVPDVPAEACQCGRCEELQVDVLVDPPTPIRFHLVNTGGPFKIVHATLMPNPTVSDPDYKPILFSGTGQVIDLTTDSNPRRVFYMNLHSSQEHADESPWDYWHDGRIVQVSLDLSTSRGTFWSVGTDYNAARDELHDGFDKLDIALVGQLPECLQD